MNKRKARKKKTGGRRAGQPKFEARKAVHHEMMAAWENLDASEQAKLRAEGTTPAEIEGWRHAELASRGDFSQVVQMASVWLGELVENYKDVLQTNRRSLEMNRRKIEMPLPFLPGDPIGVKRLDEKPCELDERKFNPAELFWLGEGHAAIWAMRNDPWTAMRLLSVLIRAVASDGDGGKSFFSEFARRIKACNPATGVSLRSPASPVSSALNNLKRAYFVERWGDELSHQILERRFPLLLPVFSLPPGERPALSVPQIAEWVWAYTNTRLSERTLIRHADAIGIPREHKRGRRGK